MVKKFGQFCLGENKKNIKRLTESDDYQDYLDTNYDMNDIDAETDEWCHHDEIICDLAEKTNFFKKSEDIQEEYVKIQMKIESIITDFLKDIKEELPNRFNFTTDKDKKYILEYLYHQLGSCIEYIKTLDDFIKHFKGYLD